MCRAQRRNVLLKDNSTRSVSNVVAMYYRMISDEDKFLTTLSSNGSDQEYTTLDQTEAEFVIYIQSNYFNRAGKHA